VGTASFAKSYKMMTSHKVATSGLNWVYKIGLCNISSFKVQQPFAQEVLSLNSLCSKFDENPTKTEVYDNSD
jgi:hypothetical protein